MKARRVWRKRLVASGFAATATYILDGTDPTGILAGVSGCMNLLLGVFATAVLACSSVIAAPAPAHLERLIDLKWDLSKEELITTMMARPGVTRRSDWRDYTMFRGGELAGHPVAEWGFQYFGDRLIRAEVKLSAPGAMEEHYEKWRNNLQSTIGGSAVTKQMGKERSSTWKTVAAAGTAKAEVIALMTRRQDRQLWIVVRDPEFSKEN